MGGEGPAVRFDSSNQSLSKAAKFLDISVLSDDQLEENYSRAKGFLLAKKAELLDREPADFNEYRKAMCWKEAGSDAIKQSDTEQRLLDLTAECVWTDKKWTGSLWLPASFAKFSNPSEQMKWERLFNIFSARRINRSFETSYIEGPSPLRDIFYLLQVLHPGMLTIYRIDDIDDLGEIEYVKLLPAAEWMENHEAVLKHILGNPERFQTLLECTKSSRGAITQERISSYSYDDYNDSDYYTTSYGHRELKDLTACDSHCGYCGTCDY